MRKGVGLPSEDLDYQDEKSGIVSNSECSLKALKQNRDKDEVIFHKNAFGGHR